MTTNNTDFRKNNGLIILQQGNIISNGENSYTVASQTFAGKQYTVELLENVWVCSCPDFEYRKIESANLSMLLIYLSMLIRKNSNKNLKSLQMMLSNAIAVVLFV
jgi:hypothetical protein